MKIRDLNEIFDEIKEEGKKIDKKDDWWAGKARNKEIGNEWFMGHPDVGLYQFKSYQKNPYSSTGVGAKLTKNVDDEIEKKFEKQTNSIFGVLPDKINKNRKKRAKRLIENPKHNNPSKLFKNLLNTLGINIRGSLSQSRKGEPTSIQELKGEFDEEQKQLTNEFKKILNRDDIYNSYV